MLARLVLERPRPILRDELLELLWPDGLADHRDGAVRKVLSRARLMLVTAGVSRDALGSVDGVVTLGLPSETSVDVESALGDVSDAEKALDVHDWGTADSLAVRASVALRRPFLPGSESHWALGWRDRLDAAAERALLTAATAALGAGNVSEAVRLAREVLAADALNEHATRLLMTSLGASGNRVAALGAFEQLRRHLDDELGVRPSPVTEDAYRELLGEAPAQPTVAVRAAAPVPGVDTAPFVGREPEVALITDEARRARLGACRIVIVEGEAGIGKTRLVAEAADAARATGASVFWGRCEPGAGIGHGPFADIVMQIVQTRPDAVARLGVVATHLSPLVPEVVSSSREAAPSSPDQATAQLFRAVGATLASVADPHLVLVLDDLQWADGDTLALLRHVVPWLAHHACTLIVTLRSTTPPVADALAELHRLAPTTTVSLRGLSVDAVGRLLTASEVRLTEALAVVAKAVTARTGGNPLYVTQLVQEAATADRPLDANVVPDAVGRLLERRLEALDPELASTLVLTAVGGPEFELATIEACSTASPDRVLDMLEELCKSRFLEERAGGGFAFAHELVRDAVLDTVGETRRRRLHQRVGDALARSGSDPASIARHYLEAGATCNEDAVTWSLTAGAAALRQAAWRAGRSHFEAATRLAPDPERRCEALIGQGHAERALGDASAARISLEHALALARAHALPDLIAAATLALVGGGGRGVALELEDREREQLLRAALDGLDDDDGLLVDVLAELALSLVLTEASDERRALCERCLTLARRSGTPGALARALVARRVALMGPGGTHVRVADGHELLSVSEADVPPEVVVAAHLGLVEDLLELGNRDDADQALAAAAETAERLDHPYWSWATACWRTLTAIIDGRLDDAERLAYAAVDCQLAGGHPEALAAFGVNLVDVRLFQGRSAEVVDMLRSAADANPQIPAYRAVLALCCAEAGDLAGARREFDWFAASNFDLPDDSNWMLAVVVLAETCVTLGDADSASALSALLAPWVDRQVILNCYGGGGAYWGPVAHHLGRLAALRGGTDEARTLLARAVELSETFRAPLFAERSRAVLAGM